MFVLCLEQRKQYSKQAATNCNLTVIVMTFNKAITAFSKCCNLHSEQHQTSLTCMTCTLQNVILVLDLY